MKSLKEYIFELKDETYLKLANRRRKQNKDISDIIEHSYKIFTKDFIKELTSFDWFKYVVKQNGDKDYEKVLILTFDEIMHRSNKANKELQDKMQDDLTNLCKKYNSFIHGLKFCLNYGSEDPTVEIYIFDRRQYLKNINENTLLYHLTYKQEFIDGILKEGIKPAESNQFHDYTYKCVFAFKDKKFINKYKKYFSYKHYFIVEFKAGDNIYFNDWMLNKDFLNELAYKNHKSVNELSDKQKENASGAIFTLSKIDKSQIVSITEIDKGKQNIIYETNS